MIKWLRYDPERRLSLSPPPLPQYTHTEVRTNSGTLRQEHTQCVQTFTLKTHKQSLFFYLFPLYSPFSSMAVFGFSLSLTHTHTHNAGWLGFQTLCRLAGPLLPFMIYCWKLKDSKKWVNLCWHDNVAGTPTTPSSLTPLFPYAGCLYTPPWTLPAA